MNATAMPMRPPAVRRVIDGPPMGEFVDMVGKMLRLGKVSDDDMLRIYEALGARREASTLWVASRALEALVADDVAAVHLLVRMGKEVDDEDLGQAIAQTVAPAAETFATVALRVFGQKYLTLSADAFASLMTSVLGPGITRYRVVRPAATVICALPYCSSEGHQAVVAGFRHERATGAEEGAGWLDAAVRSVREMTPDAINYVRDLTQPRKPDPAAQEVEDDGEALEQALADAVEDAASAFGDATFESLGTRELAIAADAFGALMIGSLGPGLTRIQVLKPISAAFLGHGSCDQAIYEILLSGMSQTYLYSD